MDTNLIIIMLIIIIIIWTFSDMCVWCGIYYMMVLIVNAYVIIISFVKTMTGDGNEGLVCGGGGRTWRSGGSGRKLINRRQRKRLQVAVLPA
jgi:hypothetical protein